MSQLTVSDEKLVEDYVAQNPTAHPDNNPTMKAQVNSPSYEDRGLWGPLGGKNGSVSHIWLDQHKSEIFHS